MASLTWTEILQARVAAATSEPSRIFALLELGDWLAASNPRLALPRAEEALAAAEDLGEVPLLAQAHRVHAQCLLFTIGPRAAYEEFRDARDRFTALADDGLDGVAWCDLFLGVALEYLGDPGGATIHIERALANFRVADDVVGQSRALTALASGQLVIDKLDEAFALLRQAGELASQTDDPTSLGQTTVKIGEVRGRRGIRIANSGRLEEARTEFVTALTELRNAHEHAVTFGHASLETVALASQVLPLCWLGRADEAVEVAERALTLAGELDLDHRSAAALHFAGMAYLVLGDSPRAIGHLHRAYALYEQWDLVHDTVAVLRSMVEAYERAGDIAAALAAHKRLLGAELRMRDRITEREDQIAVARFEAERTLEGSQEGRLRLAQLARVNRRLADERHAMERLAHTDPLTGLANRRHYDAQLARLLVQAGLTGHDVSLVLIDIDHFKQINDNYSHVVGDGVLRTVASDIARHCRVSDLACRIGGEEFAVLLPSTSLEQAASAAERLRASVEALDFSRLAPKLSVTISAGVAVACGGDAVTIVAAADKALYEAKNSGRNRVCCAEEAARHVVLDAQVSHAGELAGVTVESATGEPVVLTRPAPTLGLTT